MKRGDDNWMQTYSGKRFWAADPHVDDIDIRDIAHALSMQCRYAGHCLNFLSVAEHSVHLANYVSRPNRLWALLHDASEAYLTDIPRPTKPFLTGYREMEDKVMAVVCERYGLGSEMPIEVKQADGRIIVDERHQNMLPTIHEWSGYTDKLGIKLEFWSPGEAEIRFLEMFDRLEK